MDTSQMFASQLKTVRSDAVYILLTLACLLVLSRFVGQHFRSRRGNKGLRLPPGPKPFPIIGNAAQVPTTMIAQRFKEMTDKYGEHSIGIHLVNVLRTL